MLSNAELAEWSATKVMGWEWDEQAEQPFYETEAHYSWITNWNPCTDRNQAAMVLAKVADKQQFVQALYEQVCDAHFVRADGLPCPEQLFKLLTASAEQLMQAAWMALEGEVA